MKWIFTVGSGGFLALEFVPEAIEEVRTHALFFG
jgi:hypothetical protein